MIFSSLTIRRESLHCSAGNSAPFSSPYADHELPLLRHIFFAGLLAAAALMLFRWVLMSGLPPLAADSSGISPKYNTANIYLFALRYAYRHVKHFYFYASAKAGCS